MNFTLYDLNPDFWARVQAKAKAEGATVKAVILKLLAQWLGVLALALLTVACTSPYEPTPLPKDPIVVAPPPPVSHPTPTVQPLVVSLSVGRGSPEVGQSISFVATAGASITSAAWNFGNGATASTSSGDTAYAYPAVGTFLARVTVTASDGRTGSGQQTVTVQRRETPPRPEPTPTPGPSGLVVALTCVPKPARTPTPCNVSTSYHDKAIGSASVSKVVWDWGTGSTTATSAPAATSSAFVYPMPGSYTVFATVTAMTSDGVMDATGSQAITIQ